MDTIAPAQLQVAFQEYSRPAETAPLPQGQASLYRTPWRACVKTASAYDALDGIGVYYKHVPNEWTLQQNIAVMQQLRACGVRRLRLAPHWGMYLADDWTEPDALILSVYRTHMRACKATGMRPCVVFVHIPPAGKDAAELNAWWHHEAHKNQLPAPGDFGSKEFAFYTDKQYQALKYVLDEARSAGFTDPGSYDLEMGQNLWWGAPCITKPWPSTDLDALLPGGRIHEHDRMLMDRFRREGYGEPTVWWSQSHHWFEQMSDAEIPAGVDGGRAVSFYNSMVGWADDGYLTRQPYEKDNPGAEDTWPVRPAPLQFAEGQPPHTYIARPESFGADRTRRDCMLDLLAGSDFPVAVSALGIVPEGVHDRDPALGGWEIKSRALTRSLAFWLNQGADFVLLHSLYEGWPKDGGEMIHSLMPNDIKPEEFHYSQSQPLRTVKAMADVLDGAQKLGRTTPLTMRFVLDRDDELIPASSGGGPLRASDAITLLPFQLSPTRFAVAAYLMTPNICRPATPCRVTLELDKTITGQPRAVHPSSQTTQVLVAATGSGKSTLSFDLKDDVTFVVFDGR